MPGFDEEHSKSPLTYSNTTPPRSVLHTGPIRVPQFAPYLLSDIRSKLWPLKSAHSEDRWPSDLWALCGESLCLECTPRTLFSVTCWLGNNRPTDPHQDDHASHDRLEHFHPRMWSNEANQRGEDCSSSLCNDKHQPCHQSALSYLKRNIDWSHRVLQVELL